jgi:hypothetical protein
MYLQYDQRRATEFHYDMSLLLQDLRFSSLGVSEVHHLVQKFVYYHEIISDTLFLEFLEVLRKHFHNLVQEE